MRKIGSVLIFIIVSLTLLHFANLSNYLYDEHEGTRPRIRGIKSPNYEKIRKFKALLENIMEIERHNELYREGKALFKMKLNPFAEVPPAEFVNKRNGFRKVTPTLRGSYHNPGVFIKPPHVRRIPRKIDWRLMGAVTTIKDQGQCGSCWAFSAVGALEGQMYKKTGKLVPLSEQHLVDCSSDYGNKGCSGGFMESAFHYIKDAGGINTAESYPYEARDGKCRYDSRNNGGYVRDYLTIEEGNETQLMEAVAAVGPIAAAMDASIRTFQFYSEGVYYEPRCSSRVLDHGVLIVGYGTTDNGIDYWLVKNSYGTVWGENGYFKIARNRNNHCGIATAASYPLV